MNKLEKFKNESLELNKALNVKGGLIASKQISLSPTISETLLGGDNTGCSDSVATTTCQGGDRRYHRYNDDNTYNGYEDIC